MKRAIGVLAVSLVTLTICASAGALSSGPGGRMYLTERITDANTEYNRLWSIVIDENWDVAAAATAQTSHGDIYDQNTDTEHKAYGISPEIEQTGSGAAGYAKLVQGIYYNDTPDSLFSTGETMDVVRVTPTNGSHTVTVLGNGWPNTLSTWYGRNQVNTDRGEFACPDPAGGFTGSATNYVTTSDAYSDWTHINHDWEPDTNITDDNEMGKDYICRASTIGYARDQEIVENKMFVTSYYMGHNTRDYAGIRYYETDMSTPGSETMTTSIFYRGDSDAPGPTFGMRRGPIALAAGKVNGHDAAWCLAYDNGLSGTVGLTLFVDLNDDGDAMDNALVTGSTDEQKMIYTAADVTGITGDRDNPDIDYWQDLELVKHGGKMFMLIESNRNSDPDGKSLLVLELDDNGDYTGGNANCKLILTTGREDRSNLTGFDVGTELEFDPNGSAPIPEPTTMLLLGSGALGILGAIRRRRMR